MGRMHQDRYQEYIEFDQESRFALVEEVKPKKSRKNSSKTKKSSGGRKSQNDE